MRNFYEIMARDSTLPLFYKASTLVYPAYMDTTEIEKLFKRASWEYYLLGAAVGFAGGVGLGWMIWG